MNNDFEQYRIGGSDSDVNTDNNVDDFSQYMIGGDSASQSPLKNIAQNLPRQDGSIVRTGLSGAAKDVGESLVNTPGAILKSIMGIPGGIQRANQYANKHQVAAIGDVAMGGVDGLAALLSAPQAAARYLDEKITGNTDDALHRTPSPYEFLQKGEKYIGADANKPGQSDLRGIGQLVLGGGGLSQIPKRLGRVGAVSAASAGQGGDPLQAAIMTYLGEKGADKISVAPKNLKEYIEGRGKRQAINSDVKNLDDLESQAQNYRQDADLSENDFELIKQGIKRKLLPTDKSTLQGKADEIVEKMQETQPLAQQYDPNAPEPVEPIPGEEPQAPEAPVKPTQPVNLEPKLIENEIRDISTQLEEPLLKRKEPDAIASQHVVNDFEQNIKKPASALYDEAENLVMGENVTVPDELKPNLTLGKMGDLANTSGWGTAVIEQLRSKLASMDSSKSIPARDFFQAYRQARQTASATRKSAYGKSAQDFDSMIDKASELDAKADEMQKTLEATPFGEQALETLAKANREWRRVKDVENNSLFKQMASKGRVNGKIFDQLRGDEPGLNDINALIHQNPEAVRGVLGNKYSESPNQITNMPERGDSMLRMLPEVEELTNRLRGAQDRLIDANQQKLNSEVQHQERLRQHEAEKSQYDQDKAEHENLLKRFKDNAKQKSKKYKDEVKQRAEIKEASDKLQSLAKRLEVVNDIIESLTKSASEKGLSRQKSNAYDERIKAAKEHQARIKKLMKNAIMGLVSVAGVKGISSLMSKIL